MYSKYVYRFDVCALTDAAECFRWYRIHIFDCQSICQPCAIFDIAVSSIFGTCKNKSDLQKTEIQFSDLVAAILGGDLTL